MARRKQGDLTNPPTLTCRGCRQPFTARRANQRYCTRQCRERTSGVHGIPGSTTARGLGADHQKQRKRLLPQALGTMCPLRISPNCTGIMVDPKMMDLDHSTPRALGGTRGDRMVCRACNRAAGARLANTLRATMRARRPRW